jgi:ElaB/YqjD/DUF883 family membrane-anchored ribosome-binding protein
MTERNDDIVGRGPTAAGSAAGGSGAESGASETGAIRAGIAGTRDRMGETLAQIGDRLNPSHIASQVKETVRGASVGRAQDAMRDVADRVGAASEPVAEKVREYPLAAVAIAAGLGWLLAGSRTSESATDDRGSNGSSSGDSNGPSAAPRSPERAESAIRYPIRGNPLAARPAYAVGAPAAAASSPTRSTPAAAPYATASGSPAAHLADAGGDASSAGGGIKATATEVADRARDAAGHAAARAKELGSAVAAQAQQQTRQLDERLHESPLQSGVVALALGFAAGYVVPVSEREVQLMGSARDRLADRVKGTVEETKESVRDAVRHAVQGGPPGSSQP